MSADVAEMTLIPRPPKGREEVPSRSHDCCTRTRSCSRRHGRWPARRLHEGDDGTNDILVSNVIRTNEMQVWFVAEHVVDAPLVHADGQASG